MLCVEVMTKLSGIEEIGSPLATLYTDCMGCKIKTAYKEEENT